MKRDRQRWGWQFWMILAVGAWLGAGLGAAETAQALELFSGLLKSENHAVHCAVTNLADRPIFVRVAIRFGDGGETCDDVTEFLDPSESQGTQCGDGVGQGVYCVVSGSFTKTDVRAKFSTRDGDDNDRAVLELE